MGPGVTAGVPQPQPGVVTTVLPQPQPGVVTTVPLVQHGSQHGSTAAHCGWGWQSRAFRSGWNREFQA